MFIFIVVVTAVLPRPEILFTRITGGCGTSPVLRLPDKTPTLALPTTSFTIPASASTVYSSPVIKFSLGIATVTLFPETATAELSITISCL